MALILREEKKAFVKMALILSRKASFVSSPLLFRMEKKTKSKTGIFGQSQPVRHLNIHEYQSMRLLKKYGVAVPAFDVAGSGDAAVGVASRLEAKDFVLKAQVLAGGRGKGKFKKSHVGGVHLCNNNKQIKELTDKMIGDFLVTKQTGPEGKPCTKVLVTERLYLRRETYVAILLDRVTQGPVIVASSAGGMDIEQVAQETPQLIFKEPVDIVKGLRPEQADKLAASLGFDKDSTKKQCSEIIQNLYKLFIQTDATLVEINPLGETHDGRVLCVDCKLNFDDNAHFRHEDIFSFRDTSQEDPREVEAEKANLNYIQLDGDIGCLVNGAGLAMATMDAIKHSGGSPANFLDVGGGATKEQVQAAFSLLNSDPKVRAVLVNIFGGIMRCDTIALGLISAVGSLGLKKPLVVRLAGTNLEAAKKLIEDSGLRILTADDLEEASKKVVRVVEILKMADEAHVQISFQLPL